MLLQEVSGYATNISLLSIIYIMIIHYTGSSLGRRLLFDSLVSPFGA